MTKIAKKGESLSVELPEVVGDALGLKEGDDVEIDVVGPGQFTVARKPTREELLDRISAFRGSLPADFKFDREEANSR